MAEFTGTSRFAIERRLGEGGMGVVYLAHDRERGVDVALKTLARLDPAGISALKNEFRALADVTHPNLVALHELVSEGGEWFFTMEIIDGVSFLGHVRDRARPRTHPRIGPGESTEKVVRSAQIAPTLTLVTAIASTAPGTTPAAETVEAPVSEMGEGARPEIALHRRIPAPRCDLQRLRPALRQLAEGVLALHAAGKLHRDLKPSNVLVTGEGRVVILDFGLAVVHGGRRAERASATGMILGTPEYMSPEQAHGQPAEPASDWYAVGMMLYEALTGQLAFVGDTRQILLAKRYSEPRPVNEVVAGVPEDLAALCADCLRRAPGTRPSGAEILRRLEPGRAAEIGDPDASARSSQVPSLGEAASVSVPLVGREAELARLEEAFRSARDGLPVTVYVRGRSGMGKTALVEHFLDDLWRRKDAVILTGRCYERESVPYKAWDSLIDALGHHLAGLPREEAAALIPRDADELGRVFPVLLGLSGVVESTDTAGSETVRDRRDPKSDRLELRRRVFGALKELVRRVARRAPLVLYIDDLQWGDVDSARLLVSLLSPPDPPSVLVIGGYRSEEEESSPFFRELRGPEAAAELGETRAIAVGRLSLQDGARLASALLDATPQSSRGSGPRSARAGLAEAIAREAEGSPLFIAELVRHVQARDRGAAPADAVAGLSLDEVILGRVRALPEEARRLVEILAVAAGPIEQGLAQGAAGAGAEGGALRALRAARLLRTRGPRPQDPAELYHDRIREAVAGSLGEARLRECHLALGRALEASGRGDPDLLAAHFHGAGELGQAARYAVLAAERAAGALAFDRAARLYRMAIDWGDRRDPAAHRALQVGLGNALVNGGLGSEAAPVFLSAAEDAPPGEALELRRRAAEQLLVSGHIDRGARVLRDVLASVDVDYPETSVGATVTLLGRLARLRLRGTRFEERPPRAIDPALLARIEACYSAGKGLTLVDPVRGLGFSAQHLLLALEAGDARNVSLGLSFYGINLCMPGGGAGHERARKVLAEARSIAERLGDPYLLGVAGNCSAAAEMCLGRWKSTVDQVARANEILRTRCSGVAWEIEGGFVCSEVSLLWMGRLAELATFVRTHVREALERGDLFAATYARMHTWYLPIAADDPERAHAEMAEAIARWSLGGFHIMHFWALYGETQYDLYAGRAAAAVHRLGRAAAALKGSNILRVQFHRVFLTLLRGSAAVAAAAEGASREHHLREAARQGDRLAGESMPYASAAAALLRAGIASVRGDRSQALRQLEAAIAGFDAADMALHAACARRRRGELVGGDEGRALITRADAFMTGQGIRRPDRWAAIYAPGFSG